MTIIELHSLTHTAVATGRIFKSQRRLAGQGFQKQLTGNLWRKRKGVKSATSIGRGSCHGDQVVDRANAGHQNAQTTLETELGHVLHLDALSHTVLAGICHASLVGGQVFGANARGNQGLFGIVTARQAHANVSVANQLRRRLDAFHGDGHFDDDAIRIWFGQLHTALVQVLGSFAPGLAHEFLAVKIRRIQGLVGQRLNVLNGTRFLRSFQQGWIGSDSVKHTRGQPFFPVTDIGRIQELTIVTAQRRREAGARGAGGGSAHGSGPNRSRRQETEEKSRQHRG